MVVKQYPFYIKATVILIGLFYLVNILSALSGILVPFAFAVLFSILLNPLYNSRTAYLIGRPCFYGTHYLPALKSNGTIRAVVPDSQGKIRADDRQPGAIHQPAIWRINPKASPVYQKCHQQQRSFHRGIDRYYLRYPERHDPDTDLHFHAVALQKSHS